MIWKAIEGFVEYGGNIKEWENDQPVTMSSRWLAVMHDYDQLRDIIITESAGTVQYSEILTSLLDDVKALESDRIRNFRTLQAVRLAAYPMIHYLFTPKQYMVAFPFLGLPRLFQIDNYLITLIHSSLRHGFMTGMV
jgi:hypothetical protein